MKKIIVAFVIIGIAVFTLTPVSGRAQGPGGPPAMEQQSPEGELKHLNKKLKLTEDQKAKILPILSERSELMKRLMDNEETSFREKFPQMMKIRNLANERIAELLTDSQRETFHKMLAEEEKRLLHRPDEGFTPPEGGGPPP